jgi:hypothetical protein
MFYETIFTFDEQCFFRCVGLVSNTWLPERINRYVIYINQNVFGEGLLFLPPKNQHIIKNTIQKPVKRYTNLLDPTQQQKNTTNIQNRTSTLVNESSKNPESILIFFQKKQNSKKQKDKTKKPN